MWIVKSNNSPLFPATLILNKISERDIISEAETVFTKNLDRGEANIEKNYSGFRILILFFDFTKSNQIIYFELPFSL